eukprot:TRINITY_DN40306_c0_g1_i1.p1 TRINITY_DN40306_c0_g1~~TRINITY_DN40306_c0_g1_i1.p1  ORF type:complete len:270 (-),score=53.27 TRINITY_DN40306_c0_g1_i1:160-969(-)
MSFQDIQGGRPFLKTRNPDPSTDSQEAAALIFRLNTTVTTFNRLAGDLGTSRDSPKLRDQLNNARQQVGRLVKEITVRLKQISELDQQKDISAGKKISDAKLVKDFQAVLKDFQKSQQVAAEREKIQSVIPPSSSAPTAAGWRIEDDEEHRRLLEQQRQQLIHLENETTFNEAIIDERGQGITEIQKQVVEVNDIFKDLAVLVNDQGTIIDDIGSNIENSHTATAQARSNLAKASKSQKNRNCLSCWLPFLILGAVALVVILVFVLGNK